MAGDLTSQDVEDFTGGRLLASNLQVQAMLQAAVIVARRDAKWHVNPVRAEDLTVDGPDSRILWLPTRKLADPGITAITEDGTALTPIANRVSWSVGSAPGLGEPVRVRKRGGGYWSAEYGSIEISMTHGYTDVEAMDWRRAVLAMVDQIALVTGMPDAGALTTKKIDDVSYSYQPYISLAEETLYSMDAIFCDYRLPDVDFF